MFVGAVGQKFRKNTVEMALLFLRMFEVSPGGTVSGGDIMGESYNSRGTSSLTCLIDVHAVCWDLSWGC